MKIAGIVIMIIGLGLIVFTTITYFSSDKIAEIASVEIRATQPHNLTWSPFLGIAIMAIGAFVMLKSKK